MQQTNPLTFFKRHHSTLTQAVDALTLRQHWTPYPEDHRQFDPQRLASGELEFQAYLQRPFRLASDVVYASSAPESRLSPERSPYGMDMGIGYLNMDIDTILKQQKQAMPTWQHTGAQARVGVCLEILQRLYLHSAVMTHAIMHTTGQGYMMAFQAGGPHAQDRGLEAVATAWSLMSQIPTDSLWVKTPFQADTIKMQKHFHIVPRGIALVIGCATFPNWNSYPGLFASLVTGNPVIVKPHPSAVLPLALTVQIAQEVLQECGFDPCLVSLLVDTPDALISQEMATRPEVRLIDFTGSSQFGEWLEQHARQAQVFTEKAGVNLVLIDSVANLSATVRNLAFSLSLYSGQMCTTSQVLLIPKTGIQSPEGIITPAHFSQALANALTKFLGNNDRACMVLGAIQSPATLDRIQTCKALGTVLVDSETRQHPQFPAATIRTPLVLGVDSDATEAYGEERFGPISFVVSAQDTQAAFTVAQRLFKEKGALTFSVYSTDEAILDQAEAVAIDGKVALSCNLDQGILVNQSAAFSDYHGTGANPAANTCLTDAAFVASRFVVVQSRRHIAHIPEEH